MGLDEQDHTLLPKEFLRAGSSPSLPVQTELERVFHCEWRRRVESANVGIRPILHGSAPSSNGLHEYHGAILRGQSGGQAALLASCVLVQRCLRVMWPRRGRADNVAARFEATLNAAARPKAIYFGAQLQHRSLPESHR